MEKEMSPMTTEILKKGYLLFPIPRRYTRFGVSLWDMPDPDNGNVDTHWTYGGYEYVSNQNFHPPPAMLHSLEKEMWPVVRPIVRHRCR